MPVGLPARPLTAAQTPNSITDATARVKGAQPQRRLPASTPPRILTPWDGRYSLTATLRKTDQRD
jgi:hypothetical protein